MTTSNAHTAAAGAGGPRPAPTSALQSDSNREKKDLASWWKNFKRGEKKVVPEPIHTQGIFGVPLPVSIRYANVAISLFNEEGQSYIYGYVPIVVAKCGVFLKEKATDVEGIFRLAGSEKRIKELKVAFDSPDRYGKGLDWTGYTVHDAANILRRYFNQLPEPIIPLEFYQRFRDPLRNHQEQAVGSIEAQSPSTGIFNAEKAIKTYQALITELPPLNRQLLLYILDLLAVFASKSDMNKMTTPNLAAIFQPGILNHPQHDMAPQEYRLSQDILIFLIENQDSFLIGMQGTAADAETVREVQNGSPKAPGTPPTPNRSKTVINRSASNSSVAAESVRKFGSIRRNLSVSSKQSKRSDGAPTPVTASPVATTGSVHRSNTVPSRRGVNSAAPSPRFMRERLSGSPSPSTGRVSSADAAPVVGKTLQPSSIQNTPVVPNSATFASVAPPEVISASSSEATTPLASAAGEVQISLAKDFQTPKKDTTPLLAPQSGSAEKTAERSLSSTTPGSSSRKFLDILKQSPTGEGETRKPNKLQKKRMPGTSLSSAHSSSHSLHDNASDVAPRSPISPRMAPVMHTQVISELPGEHMYSNTSTAAPVASTSHRNTAEQPAQQGGSPAHSFHSHTDDTSDADLVGDDMPTQADDVDREKKRNRWRFSRSNNKLPSPPAPLNPLGAMTARDMATSRSTIGSTVGSSATSQPRKSFQEPATPLATVPSETGTSSGDSKPNALTHPNTDPAVFSDSERERKSGPMSWIRGKIQERKDNKDVEKRSRTPDRSSSIISGFQHERSKSRQDLQGPPPPLPPLVTLPVQNTGSDNSREVIVPPAPPAVKIDSPASHTPRLDASGAAEGSPLTAVVATGTTLSTPNGVSGTTSSVPSVAVPAAHPAQTVPQFTTWAPVPGLVTRSITPTVNASGPNNAGSSPAGEAANGASTATASKVDGS